LKTFGLLFCGRPAPFAWKINEDLSLILSAATLGGDVTADANSPAHKSLGQKEQNVFSELNH